MHRTTLPKFVARWLTVAAVLAALTAPEPAAAQEPELTRTGARKTLVVKAIERTKGAAVNLHTERPGPAAGPAPAFGPGPPLPMAEQPPRPVKGMGTGIVIDARGLIVTNQHVIDGVSKLECKLENGTSYEAEEIARDKALDLAIIKITPREPLPTTMPLGTASDLMLGETVIAIGNAYGYEHTVSVGVISALKRDVNLNPATSYRSLIQTDAAINPGNSGGPLINVHGELIGVNVAIRDKAQNIGFAIPVDPMIRSVRDMLHSRRKTYDGIVASDHLKDGPDGPVRRVQVEKIDEGSPAVKAGLKPGDVLVKMNELPIVCSYDVERAMYERKAGDKIAVVVLRQGKEERLQLIVAEKTVDAANARVDEQIRSKLGLRLSVADREKLKLSVELKGGLEVTQVDKDSVAAAAGIRKGDILVGLHHWETVSLDNVQFVLDHPELKSFSPLKFYILRDGQVRKGTFPE